MGSAVHIALQWWGPGLGHGAQLSLASLGPSVYPTLPEALQRRWDQVEQDLADELITTQVSICSGLPLAGPAGSWVLPLHPPSSGP